MVTKPAARWRGDHCTGSTLLHARHQQTQTFSRGLLARDDIHDAPLVDHGNAVGKGQDLIKVL